MNDFLNKKIIEVQQPQDDPFFLIWTLNNFCNNSCSYCPTGLRNGKEYYYDINNIKFFLDKLFQKHKKIRCHISGGEPTLHPLFLDIVKIFYQNNNKVSVITNGFKSIDFWEQNYKYFDFILFSFHPTSKFNNNFIDKIKIINKTLNVGVRIMMLPSHWDLCVKFYNEIKKENIEYELVKIMNFDSNEKEFYFYSKEQNDWMEENKKINQFKNKNILIFNDKTIKTSDDFSFNDLINNDMTNFYGYKCDVGLKTLSIDWNGNIFLSSCGINGSIGNINNVKDIKWPSSPVICNKKKCYCTTDVYISKKKNFNIIKII
jgi:MoaA/NifB/PqqE/SkfB family radical SAM enzyme